MAIKDVPQVLNNFEVYKSGTNRLYGMAKIKLPSLEHLSTEIKGNGIAGEISVNVRGAYSDLETTITFRGVRPDAVDFLEENSSHRLTAYGAFEYYDAGSGERKVVQFRADMRGTTKSLEFGEWEPGEAAEAELVLTLDYLKYSVDGKELLLIDKYNFISRVNGIDFLDAVRLALALA